MQLGKKVVSRQFGADGWPLDVYYTKDQAFTLSWWLKCIG